MSSLGPAAALAAGALAFEASVAQAQAAGADKRTATMRGLGVGAAAAGISAGVGYGMGKAVAAAGRGLVMIAPRLAPALGPAGIVIAGAFLTKGALEGWRETGSVKGAVFGAVSGGRVPEAWKRKDYKDTWTDKRGRTYARRDTSVRKAA